MTRSRYLIYQTFSTMPKGNLQATALDYAAYEEWRYIGLNLKHNITGYKDNLNVHVT